MSSEKKPCKYLCGGDIAEVPSNVKVGSETVLFRCPVHGYQSFWPYKDVMRELHRKLQPHNIVNEWLDNYEMPVAECHIEWIAENSKIAKALRAGGVTTVNEFLRRKDDELLVLKFIGPKTLKKLRLAAWMLPHRRFI